MRKAKPPCKRPRLMRQLRSMYELERAGDRSASNAAFLSLPDECRAVLCLVMFYGRCKAPVGVGRWYRGTRGIPGYDEPTPGVV